MMEAVPNVVLVHGLGRSRHDMFLLAPRLRRALPQSTIHVFDYSSRSQTLAESKAQLADFIEKNIGESPVSFVGHSLGGIVVRALDDSNLFKAKLHRLVTLGSPHNGAVIAKYLNRYATMRSLFGPVLEELGSLNLPASTRQLEVGCIIGVTSTRFGFLPVLGGDNDGLVRADEALLSSCSAHTSLFSFHGLMPFSKKIALLSARFLSSGSFN